MLQLLQTVFQDNAFAFCELQLFGEGLLTVQGLIFVASHLNFPHQLYGYILLNIQIYEKLIDSSV